MVRILNFGSCNIDLVYNLDHVVLKGETESSSQLTSYPGGKGLNHSVSVAKAGGKVYHAGLVGSDGGDLIDIMKQNGVDVSYMRTVDGKSGHAIIQVTRDGDNGIITYPGANRMFTEEYIDSVLSNFDKNDILLLQNEINLLDYIVDRAYEKGMRIVLNPSPADDGLKNTDFNKLTYLVLNEVEAKGLTGTDDPEASIVYLLRSHPQLKIMLNLGRNGSVYADAEKRIYHPSFKVDVVDTTGAGNVFSGFFIGAIANGKDEQYAIRYASAAGAIAMSRMGAATSVPCHEEVEEALCTLKPNKVENDDETRKKQITGYIEANISDGSLIGLSEILGYSTVYVSLLVKRLMGKTFSSLMQEKRCELSAKLLRETDMPIDEIIYAVGYENESFFRRIFKQRYGESPLKYRMGMRRKV